MISVIVTTYNIEQYIEQCLRSVVNQTYRDLEVIVVDDGSSDSTQDVVRSIAREDSRIIPVFLPENTPGGVAIAANTGLSKARGEYIGFVDGDDWCEPFMFEKLIESSMKHDSEIVIGNFKNYDEKSSSFYDASDRRFWLKGLPVDEPIEGMSNKKTLLKFNPVPWRKLYKREFLEENNIRFPEGDYFYEDNPFHWFCITRAERFSLVPDYLCYHRMNRAGQTMSTGDKRLLAMYEHHQTIHEWLKTNNLLDQFKKELVLWVVNNTCWIHDAIKDEYKDDVLLCLNDELSKYDGKFLDEVLNSSHMGNKGRVLAGKARGEGEGTGQGEQSRKSGLLKENITSMAGGGLVRETVQYYQQYGALETARKIRSYLVARMPGSMKRAFSFFSRPSKKTSDVDKNIKDIKTQLEFQKLMLVLSEKENETIKDDLKEIKSELREIRERLG